MKSKLIILTIFISLFFSACDKEENPDYIISGDQSTIGTTDNSFTITAIEGVSSMTAAVTALEDGVSTITLTAQVTDTELQTMAAAISDADISGTSYSCSRDYRITTDGIQSVYPEGNIILVEFDAKVGDTYKLDMGSYTLERKVTHVSTDDDYYWNGMNIKTIDVEETGEIIPGVLKITYIVNHRFGIVGLKVFFEDGTTKTFDVYSYLTN